MQNTVHLYMHHVHILMSCAYLFICLFVRNFSLLMYIYNARCYDH
uniref:Uncharacterized protein n=1 Tax=Setaria italica TaxID=4555 RepID=K3YNR1_SETIT